MPDPELHRFRQHIQYARDMAATAGAMSALATSALDVSDLYRAALMQGVSAFDFFMHEEIRARMISLHGLPATTWPPGFRNFRVPVAAMQATSTDPHLTAVEFNAEIQRQHGFLSFQNPDKVAEACRLVSSVDIWDAVARARGLTRQGRLTAGQVAKKDWSLIIDRRNLIVHEADVDPTPPRDRRYAINRADAETALSQIEEVTSAIANAL